MVFDVEEDVALPLEDHGLTDDLRKDVGAVVLGAYSTLVGRISPSACVSGMNAVLCNV